MNSKIFTDQLGNQFLFKEPPVRIISLVPSQTELLYDLGLEENIVGITKFCVHPYHFKTTKAIIGGTKNVNLEKIIQLKPDIIIANKEENTKDIVNELSKLYPVWITNIYSIEDNLQMIRDLGQLFNKRDEARKWIDEINFAHQDFLNFIKQKDYIKVAYFIWANPYMVAGNNTFINEMLKHNKFHNIYQNKEGRYPEVTIQNIKIEGNPDLILLSSEPFPFKEKHALEIGSFAHPAKTICVDGEMFSWYGSRLVEAFKYFKQLHQMI